MAYGFGSGIRPELGATNYSGVLQGALAGAQLSAQGQAAIGQGLANLGQQLGGAIQQYYAKKEQKELENQAVSAFQSIAKENPQIAQSLGIKDPNDTALAKAVVKGLGGPGPALGLASQLQQQTERQGAAEYGAAYQQYGGQFPSMFDQRRFTPSQRMAGTNMALQQRLLQKQVNEQPEGTALQKNVEWLVSQGVPQARALEIVQGGTTVNIPGETVKVMPDGRIAIVDPKEEGGIRFVSPPGSAAASEASKTESAKSGVTTTLRGMANNLNKLFDMGAAVSSTQGAGQNIVNRIRASDVGQMIEGAVGTEAQAIRQAFRNSIPVFINDMRQSTEMSARGMDSEKELEFYLQSAGSEKADVVTSMAALYAAGERFGSGGTDVLRDLSPALKRAVLIRAGALLDEGQADKYRGNVTTNQSPKSIFEEADAIIGQQHG